MTALVVVTEAPAVDGPPQGQWSYSPGNKAYDQQVKLDAYARAGLPEYAIVDPAARSLSR